ncbi:MAG: glycosyltransferase family 9 protein [Phycisphaerales bacterium]
MSESDPAIEALAAEAVSRRADNAHESSRGGAWVFHRGALGDSVLLWPLLRVLRAGCGRVTLVADGSKARLAARHTGVRAREAEERRFGALWGECATDLIDAAAEVVVGFGPTESVWARNLGAAFPAARVVVTEARPDGRAARRIVEMAPWSLVPAMENPGGPLVAHVGAGGDRKRWPMTRWAALLDRWRGERMLLAGEVERERFSTEDRQVFARLGGEMLETIEDLERRVMSARVFVGADTGPTHLAAALGVPTVAIFGPTDARLWSPVGPRVRVVWRAEGEEWPSVERVMEAVHAQAQR